MLNTHACLIGSLILTGGCVKTADAPPRRDSSPAGDSARPVLVLVRHSVWFPFVDRPLFILYADGSAILPVSRERGVPLSYKVARLDGATSQARLTALGIGPEFYSLNDTYDLRPNVTDQETVAVFVWRGDELKRVAVRGATLDDSTLSEAAPSPIRNVFRKLATFQTEDGNPWRPTTVEVAAWPYEYAPDDPPLEWPATWPDLNTPGSRRRADALVGEIWTIPLPYERLSELTQLLENRREKQAIRINGRKWAVSYRLPFPNEQRWRAFFSDLE
jgi:hypothetical protein